jgi:hypothetical protein
MDRQTHKSAALRPRPKGRPKGKAMLSKLSGTKKVATANKNAKKNHPAFYGKNGELFCIKMCDAKFSGRGGWCSSEGRDATP